MAIATDHLFTVRLQRDAARAVRINDGPHGTKAIAPVAEGGTFAGERLRGRVVTGGSADWATIRADGSFLIDARLTLLTDDEVPILMTYRGVGAFDENGDAWMHTGPLFETGAGPYEWLNQVQAVAFGRFEDNTVIYDVDVLRPRPAAAP